MVKRLCLPLVLVAALWPCRAAYAENAGDWITLLSLGAAIYPAYTIWSEREESWLFFAGSDPRYRAAFTMAMVAGEQNADYGNGSNTATGFELAFNSPLLQPLDGARIRQQISHVTYNRDGARIASLEANPHYLYRMSPQLELGFGPGIGLVEVGVLNTDRVVAFQLGVSAHYRANEFYLGAELRHQFTGKAKSGNESVDADNTRLVFKIGFWL